MTSQVSFQALVSNGRQAPSLDSPEVPLQVNVKMDVACFHHLWSDLFCWGVTTGGYSKQQRWWQSGSMARSQGGDCKNFCPLFSLPRDNLLLPQHPSFHCIFYLPQTQTQVRAPCHPSRAAMPLPCFHHGGHPATLSYPCTYASCHVPSLLGAADILRY